MSCPHDGEKRSGTQRNVARLALLVAAAVGASAIHPGSALATPAIGYKSAVVAVGSFGDIDVFNYANPPDLGKNDGNNLRRLREKTNGQSNLYVQRNVWQPKGSTGWHSHPGSSLIIVTLGTVTDYEGDDPNCTPHVYTKGMGFVDHGGDHAHIIRNESDTEAQTIAIQFIPTGANRRIDVPDPGHCHF